MANGMMDASAGDAGDGKDEMFDRTKQSRKGRGKEPGFDAGEDPTKGTRGRRKSKKAVSQLMENLPDKISFIP